MGSGEVTSVRLLRLSPTVVLVALVVLTGCLGQGADTPVRRALGTPKPKPTIPAVANEQDCAAAGGKWRKVDPFQPFACIFPASDAGKPCDDSGQCDGVCWRDVRPVYTHFPGDPPTPTQEPFHCSDTINDLVGCHEIILDGKAHSICAD
jgi:hypothetical protein